MKSILISASVLLCSIFVSAQNHSGPQEDIDAILASIREFSTLVVSGDHKAIADAYTKDAKIFPNQRDILSGRKAIQKYWKRPKGSQTIGHRLTSEEINVLGDEAYDYGYFEGTTRRDDGSETSWRGKYVVVWKKVDGEWKMYLDIWNSIRS